MQKLNSASVLEFVRLKGPCLPNDIKKQLGSDTMIIGAILSELLAGRKIFVSTLKVGGSPLYYFPGQEFKLQQFNQYLNEKDRAAFELLKTKRVLRDSQLTPLMRVAVRSIKDFAKALEVNVGQQKEIFWKWYLLPNDIASDEIRSLVGARTEASRASVEKADGTAEKPMAVRVPEKPAIMHESKPARDEQKHLVQEKKAEPKKASSEFLDEINEYFSENKIEVLETNSIKKSSEIDFVIRIPSPVGSLRYYCKARSKKKLNHADLSAAYVSGESKKLPILLLIKGELNKKAEGMLDKEFKNMSVQKL